MSDPIHIVTDGDSQTGRERHQSVGKARDSAGTCSCTIRAEPG